MKNIKNIKLLGLAAIFFATFSCSEESEIGSSVTNYPVFDYEETVIVPVGGAYTATATATENGIDIPVEISGADDVNTSTVGIYNVSFSAINADGFAATVVQTVVVHDPNIIGTDVSGNVWDKNNHSRTAVISLVPGTTSIFYTTDFGFAGAFPIYFQMDGDTISDIPQVYPLDQESVSLQYNAVAQEFVVGIQPAAFSYTFEYY